MNNQKTAITKEQQYREYILWGGTMTIAEWEMDGRYDKYAEAVVWQEEAWEEDSSE